jgi:hypothetical protein
MVGEEGERSMASITLTYDSSSNQGFVPSGPETIVVYFVRYLYEDIVLA